MIRYVIVQTVESGTWRHYFCGWLHGDVPIWDTRRDEALKLDEQTARQIIKKLDARYRGVVWHSSEELPQ